MIYTLVCKINDKRYSYGTAFVLDDSLITAAHIVMDCEAIYIYNENIRHTCEIIKIDKRLDLALLSVKIRLKHGLPKCSRPLRDGENVILKGTLEENARLVQKTTKVSCAEFICDSVYGGVCVDLPHSQGFSGCPILNDKNQVGGIITWSYDNKFSGGCHTSMIEEFLKYSRKNTLGVQVKYLKPHEMIQYGLLNELGGCLVYKIWTKYQGKLKKYDMITKVDNIDIGINSNSLERYINYLKVKRVNITYRPYMGNSTWGKPEVISHILYPYPEEWDTPYYFQSKFIKYY